MRTRAAILVAIVSACGGVDETTAPAPSDDGQEVAASAGEPKVQLQRDLAIPAAGSNLVDHGGKVLAQSHTYAIWWGNQSAFPSDAKAGLASMFQGLNGTSFLGIAKQYMRGAAVSTSFAGAYTDTSAPPSNPGTSTIAGEACKIINNNHLTADSSAIYFVFTSNFPSGAGFCAWHSYGTCNGKTIQVAYMPNTNGVSGCTPPSLNCNSYSVGTRSLANVTSHEYVEAITDATVNAWIDPGGQEIGDKCAWKFSSCVNLSNGKWQLQQEWSNSARGCVQQ